MCILSIQIVLPGQHMHPSRTMYFTPLYGFLNNVKGLTQEQK